MIQIIDEIRKPTGLERFGKIFGDALQGGAAGGQAIKGALDERKTREALAERFGDEFKNIKDPNARQMMLQGSLQRENQAHKLKGELDLENKSFDQIKKAYGEKFANVWRAMGQGERTALVQGMLKAQDRGLDVDEFLRSGASLEDQNSERFGAHNENSSGLPDFTQKPKGRSWSEWTKEMSGWGKTNTKTLEEARDRLKGNKRDILGTKKLQKIEATGKLPEGFERLIINPETGSPYGLAQLAGLPSTEAQEWGKEIARFGNRAKDAFGSRVTNFDLIQYMKQFPSLLNTSEGRQRILRMMEINYELDSLYDNAAQQIIDDFGEDKIPPAQVDKMARRLIKNREEQLFDEYLNIESENESSFMKEGMSRPSLEEIFGG